MNPSVNPRLSILFLNYNRLKDTMVTTAHLRALTERRNDTEVIAVDNGSKDGTADFLARQSDWMQVLRLEDNIGIAGLNRGACLAKGDYILVLDDDSHPKNPETMDRLIRILDQCPSIGVIACRIDSPEGKPVRTWHLPDRDSAGSSLAFVGCGFAIRRELFQRVGGFPEPFFLYQNEIETAIRLMREGYRIYFDPDCRIIHRASAIGRPSWRRVYFPTRNTLWIIRHYFPFPTSLYLIFSRMLLGLVRAVQLGQIQSYIEALRDGLGAKILFEKLPEDIEKRMTAFKRNNDVFYHLTHTRSVKLE